MYERFSQLLMAVIRIADSKDKYFLYSTQDGVTLQPYLPHKNTFNTFPELSWLLVNTLQLISP